MRKHLLILLLLLLSHFALAQVQVLPDLEVSGESPTKIFLYKKALPYSLGSSLADSLSFYLPQDLPPVKLSLVSQKKPALSHYFAANAHSNAGAGLIYRYYPKGPKLRSLGLQADIAVPKAEYQSRYFSGGGDVDFSKYLQLRAQASFQENESPKGFSEILSGQVSSFSHAFALGDTKISGFTNLWKYTQYSQETSGVNTEIKSLLWQHLHQIEIGKYSLQNSAYLHGEHTALMLQLSSTDYFFDRSGVFVLYDDKHFIPGFAFHSAYNLSLNQNFSIGNYPRVQPQDFASILSEYPYVDATAKMLHSLLPLNLLLEYEWAYPDLNPLGFESMKMLSTSQYTCNQPVLQKVESKLVALAFQDVAENTSALKLSFAKGNISFEQKVALSLAWLSRQNWRIKPYQAPLKLDSELAYSEGKWQAALSFQQKIAAFKPAEDSSTGKKQKYSLFDFDVLAAYQVLPAGHIYLKGLNLLNIPHIIHPELPAKGRELQAGLGFWF